MKHFFLTAAFAVAFLLPSFGQQKSLSGTYSIGSGASDDILNLTTAFAQLTAEGVDGPVVFELSADYDTGTETFPLQLDDFSGNTSVNHLTIKPAEGVTTNITGSSGTGNNNLIRILAPFTVIEGSNTTGDFRNLIIENIYNSGDCSVIVIDANNVTVKNCQIIGRKNTHITHGINIVNGSSCFVYHNQIEQAAVGIHGNGADYAYIGYNDIGHETAEQSTSIAGIYLISGNGATIRDNHVFNVRNTDHGLASGIGVAAIEGNLLILNNRIDSVVSEAETTPAYGIYTAGCETDMFFLANNSIDHVASACGSETNQKPTGILLENELTTSGTYVYHNTVNMTHNPDFGMSDNGNPKTSIGMYINTTGIYLKNNIINNMLGSRNGATVPAACYSIMCNTGSDNPFLQNDYNLFFAESNATYNILAYANAQHQDLSTFQSWTGQAANSLFENPLLNDTCYPQPCSRAVFGGTYLDDVSTDILGLDRDSEMPTIGAYEYQPVQASNVFLNHPIKEGWAQLEWTEGNACQYIAFMKAGHVLPETPLPENGSTYTANPEFGLGDEIGSSGWYCVYKGNENYIPLEGPIGLYTVMLCGFFGEAGNEVYLTETATDNPYEGSLENDISELQWRISLYPNPTSGAFTIQTEGNQRILSYKIFDISGKTIFSSESLGQSCHIFDKNLPAGIYPVHIQTDEGHVVKRLIVK